MVSEARRLILFGLVTILISVSGWSVHATVQATEEDLERMDPQNLGLTEADVADRTGTLHVKVWGEQPEQYIDLTEEVITKYPLLLTAVQSLEETNQTKYRYTTTKGALLGNHSYIERRTQEKYNCTFCEGNFIKYQGKFYLVSVSISMVNKTTSTSEAPQTTPTVADGLSAFGVLSLLGTGIGIYFARRLNNGQKN